MEWRKSYLDLMLVPCGLLLSILYHGWLWHKVRTQPKSTIIGINAAGRRLWVLAIMKRYAPSTMESTSRWLGFLYDNDKKNILAVQTLRNTIMGASLMATTSILLCSGLAAVLSSTYSIKKPLNDTVYGSHGEFMMALKYVTLFVIFLFSFMCHSLSIRFVNQVNFLINIPQDLAVVMTPEYVAHLLEKGFILNTVGNRLFYAALPLLLWILGPVLVFLCSITMIPILYNHDVVYGDVNKDKNGGQIEEVSEKGFTVV